MSIPLLVMKICIFELIRKFPSFPKREKNSNKSPVHTEGAMIEEQMVKEVGRLARGSWLKTAVVGLELRMSRAESNAELKSQVVFLA